MGVRGRLDVSLLLIGIVDILLVTCDWDLDLLRRFEVRLLVTFSWRLGLRLLDVFRLVRPLLEIRDIFSLVFGFCRLLTTELLLRLRLEDVKLRLELLRRLELRVDFL